MKKLLVLSHVLPFPGNSGQQLRVKNKLKSLKKNFHVTFVTFGHPGRKHEIEAELSDYCEKVICLPSKYSQNILSRVYFSCLATLNAVKTGLKASNYIIGDLEFSPSTLSTILDHEHFDCAIFEYWHAFKSVEVFHKNNVPCVLDMHNILRQSYLERQNEKSSISRILASSKLAKYTAIEELAWKTFDGIIAINRKEHEYVKQRVSEDCNVFYTPMGIDLDEWPFEWRPTNDKPRVGYYGGLASRHNQQSALFCYENIMPNVWEKFPNTEFWIIGSNPPDEIIGLSQADSRVVVTGFVKDVKPALQTMSAIVCPWVGKYGFRSRVIEVMALGIPLVTTHDAVFGMELRNGRGVQLAEKNSGLQDKVLQILSDKEFAAEQSRISRLEVERLYSFENTYDKLSGDLDSWLDKYSVSS